MLSGPTRTAPPVATANYVVNRGYPKSSISVMPWFCLETPEFILVRGKT